MKTMLKSGTYNSTIINLRQMLHTITGVKLDRILNGFSVRGVDLVKIISNDEELIGATSINLNDIFIVFTLEESNKDYFVTHEEDGSDSLISYYDLNLSIYGNDSPEVAQLIMVRLKNEQILTDLYNNGVFVQDVSYPTNSTEFINDTAWIRRDMTINVKIRHNFGSIEEQELKKLSNVKVIRF